MSQRGRRRVSSRVARCVTDFLTEMKGRLHGEGGEASTLYSCKEESFLPTPYERAWKPVHSSLIDFSSIPLP